MSVTTIPTPDRFCDHGTPAGSPCDLCTALGEMAADPTGISDDWRHPPVCDGCGQLHAVFKQCADGRLLCPNCWPNTPAGSPCGRCAALGEMTGAETKTAHDSRCVCHGRGYWFAGRRRIKCRYRPCTNCGNRPYERDKALAGVPTLCEWCRGGKQTLFATAAELDVPPVAPGDGDLSRIRVADIDRFSPEGEAFLRKRAERKAKYDRINGAADLAGLGAL